ncbi:MAG: DNA-binding protein WhiA [Gudongella sp.]|jgi:DNA-binding protein WhiA|nr:DNA-binding protein WhiA [Gudongella sp.]
MSFSSQTKNELSRMEIEDDCCALAELSALVRMNGSIQLASEKQINLRFTTENAAIARRIFSILKLLYQTEIEVMVRRNRQLKKNNSYLIVIHDKEISRKILSDVGFIKEDMSNLFDPTYSIPEEIISKRCCRRSYIRGSFLGGGSLSNPEKTYHLEFVTNREEHAENLRDIINSFGLSSKIIQRKENFVVYIKEGEQIVDILNIIGAHQALLKLEDIRVLKDVRNNINRIVNCETANLEKTIEASIRQKESIELISRKMGLGRLPDNLREIAELRLSYPDASLKEIGELANPPLGKSGVNHRFRKIEEIAEEIRGGE